jgi:cytoplasmic tRNA 2-thiolation protein 2
VYQTSERITQIREAVTRYEEYEFIPVRVQDAFDRGWWERVSGGTAPRLAELPFGLGIGGGVSNFCFLFLFSKALSFSLDSGPISALQSYLRALPTPTAIQSTLSTLTRLLLLYTAYSIGASHLALGTSLTSLSISLISSISQGGGFVVPQAIHEEWLPPVAQRIPGDNSWNGEVHLVRPLRDVGMKECTAWVWWHQLPVVGKQRAPASKQTIGDLTKGRYSSTRDSPSLISAGSVGFIIGLERDYPSTVSTIAKTVGKLAPKGKSGIRCILCEL